MKETSSIVAEDTNTENKNNVNELSTNELIENRKRGGSIKDKLSYFDKTNPKPNSSKKVGFVANSHKNTLSNNVSITQDSADFSDMQVRLINIIYKF